MVSRDIQKIVYRLHTARAKLAPSIKLRRAYLTSAFHGQLRAEKDSIEGFIGKLQPGVRKVYLQNRLALLDARQKMKPIVGLV